MILPGIRAVVVYNPATGGTVQIPNIVARSFEFSKVPYDTGERSPMGASVEQSDSSSVGFEFVDTDGSLWQALDALRLARTRVSLIAVGSTVCVQWYEADHFTITRLPLGGAMVGRGDVYSFEMTREGHGRHAIYQQANIIAHVAGHGASGWSYVSGGVATGYTSVGSGTLSWLTNDNAQQIETNTPLEGIYTEVVFPLQLDGYALRFSSEIFNSHADNDLARVEMRFYNFADSQLSVNSVQADVSRVGISLSAAASTALYKIRVYPLLTPTGVTTTSFTAARYPALRVDGSDDYVDH